MRSPLLACLVVLGCTAPPGETDDTARDSGDTGTAPSGPDCSGGSAGADGAAFREVDGVSYWILVPGGLPECAPLVVFLHPGSQPGVVRDDGMWDGKGSGLTAMAGPRGFALAVPYLEEDRPAEHVWDLSATGELDALIEDAWSAHSLDRARTLVFGHSAGGHMAARYGLYAPRVPSHLAVTAAGLGAYFGYPEEEPDPRRPFFVAHDPEDQVVPYQFSQDLVAALQEHGHEVLYRDIGMGPGGHQLNPDVSSAALDWFLEPSR